MKLNLVDAPVSQKLELHGEITAILESANKQLGYSPEANVIQGDQRPLGDALRKLGIQVFSQKSVDAYKRSKTRHGAIYVITGFALLAVASWLWTMITGTIAPAAHFDAALGCAIACTVLTIIAFSFSESESQLTWHKYNLASAGMFAVRDAYRKAIPVHVLSKALEIKTAFPSAQFYVDALITRREERFLNDPFLVVESYSGESYYVEVWDEPKFESTL